ncbi:MAG: ATP synthase F1 subunit epsilon [Mangrovibacterium sp.]
MNLEVITPDKKLYTGEIYSIRLPGTRGSFEILHNHAPIISTLNRGELEIVAEDKERLTIEIGGGLVECRNNTILVLAEPAKPE